MNSNVHTPFSPEGTGYSLSAARAGTEANNTSIFYYTECFQLFQPQFAGFRAFSVRSGDNGRRFVKGIQPSVSKAGRKYMDFTAFHNAGRKKGGTNKRLIHTFHRVFHTSHLNFLFTKSK